MVTMYCTGASNIFTKNTIHTTGASATVLPGTASTFSYNEVTNTGLLQSDGAVFQGTKNYVEGSNVHHNFIYDINEYGTIESNIITCECNLELNTQYRVIINDIKERDIIVKDNLENNKYRIDGYIHNYEEYNSDKIFIQGREVNDFHYLNKNAIFTMNVNVTQELYKMIIDQNKLIKEKEEEIEKQNEILNNLIYRIELLENK